MHYWVSRRFRRFPQMAGAVSCGSAYAVVRRTQHAVACQAGNLPGWSAVATALRASSIAASALPTFCLRLVLDFVVLSLIELEEQTSGTVSSRLPCGRGGDGGTSLLGEAASP